MRVHGQVSGVAYPEPTKLVSLTQRTAILKPAKLKPYAVSAERLGESHFVLCDSVDEAISVQAGLLADGWVTIINPPPPKLKGGKATSQSAKGRKIKNLKRGTPDSPKQNSAEMVRPLPVLTPAVHNTITESCGKCHLLPCECNYPLFSHATTSHQMVGADGRTYHDN